MHQKDVVESFGKKIKDVGEELFGVPISDITTLIPGVCLTTFLLVVSMGMGKIVKIGVIGSVEIQVPEIVLALLLGILIANLFSVPNAIVPGSKFSREKLLKLGIILIGFRLAIGDVFRLGLMSLPIIIACVGAALVVTYTLSNKLNQSSRLGALIAVGTSICGISAIIAAGASIKAKEEETAYAIASITLFGLVSVFIYPVLGHILFNGDPTKVGLWMGTSIQDTSQVIGAALAYAEIWDSPLVVEVASLTKVIRNVFMIVVIPLISIVHYKGIRENIEIGLNSGENGESLRHNYLQYFPIFIIGFVILSMIRTIGDWRLHSGGEIYGMIDQIGWAQMIDYIGQVSNILFIIALAGVGLSTNLGKIRALGKQAFLIGVAAAAVTGLVSFILISLTV